MSEFTIDTSKVEIVLLKRVAELIDTGEVYRAIALLQDALKIHSDSEAILNGLIRLFKQTGQIECAKKYNKVLLDIQRSQLVDSTAIINDNDFSFIHSQSEELSEVEYSFDEHKEKPSAPKKILSLKSSNRKNVEKIKITVRKKFKQGLREQDVAIGSQETHIQTVDELAKKEENYKEHSTKAPLSDNEGLNNSINKKETHQKISATIPTAAPLAERTLNDLQEENSNKQDNISNNLDDQAEEDILVDTEEVDELIVLDDFKWSDDEYLQIENDSESLDFNALGMSQDEDSNSGPNIELYDFWEDESFNEQYDEENEEDTGALDSSLTQEERARMIAVECVLNFKWDRNTLPFLVEVFSSKGWSNSKKALEREVIAGTSFEELELAHEIKGLWFESSRYWISFSRASSYGESTDAVYRHFSWKQALRLLRVFETLPSYEEVYDFLEREFEFWFNHSVLRKCFPAFIKYLFNYRLHDRNIAENIYGFGNSEAYDGLNASWNYNTHSDEMIKLRSLGVDLSVQYAPKSYFCSDKYTFEYLLNSWRLITPENERGN